MSNDSRVRQLTPSEAVRVLEETTGAERGNRRRSVLEGEFREITGLNPALVGSPESRLFIKAVLTFSKWLKENPGKEFRHFLAVNRFKIPDLALTILKKKVLKDYKGLVLVVDTRYRIETLPEMRLSIPSEKKAETKAYLELLRKIVFALEKDFFTAYDIQTLEKIRVLLNHYDEQETEGRRLLGLITFDREGKPKVPKSLRSEVEKTGGNGGGPASTTPAPAGGSTTSGSSVSGLMDATGETSGGANIEGAAHVHPATRGTAGRTQRRFGHTQLAGARTAIQARQARPVVAAPVRPIAIVAP